MSNQCDHGHLRRVCEVCQRDDEIESLRQAYSIVTDDCRNLTEKVIPNIRAERDAAVALLREVNEKFIYKGRGATHWEGCEESHPDCAMAKRIEAIIDAARSKT